MPRFAPHPERRPAVVTGASAGIGAATALALAAAGHPVVLGARRVEVCQELVARIRADGGEAEALHLDLANAEAIERFAADAGTAFGPLEIVVSNAGEVFPTTGVATDPAAFAAQVQINLLGAQRLVHAIAPGMVARGRGDLVFVTSDVVRTPRPSMSSYVTSKWGLEGFARALQMELEGTGVRASIISPGPTSTEQGRTWDPEVVGDVLTEWQRWGLMRHPGYLRPTEVADTIATVVAVPRGTHLTLVEIQPEAPTADPPGSPEPNPPEAGA